MNALEPSLANKPKSGPIGEALDLDPYGTGINRAVDMGLILDRNTPDRRETTEQSLSAAADAYREVVVDGNADPAEIDRERLQSELESQADPATGHEDDNDTEGNTEATSSPLLEEIDAEPPEEYEGTDVWMTELPQFGDEKRDLDDFFQENWLALVPPSNWVLRAAGLIGDPEDEANGPDGEHSGLWIDELAADETPLTDGPSGFTLEDVVFPPTNARVQAATNIGSKEPATSDLKVGLGYEQVVVAETEEPVKELSKYDDSPYVETVGIEAIPNDESLITFHLPYRLFGYLPTIHPSEHPALTDSVSIGGSGSSLDVDPQEQQELETEIKRIGADGTEDDGRKPAWQKLTGKHNPLWHRDLEALGFKKGFRGKNPWGHHGESENYFVVYESDNSNQVVGYCHKNEQIYYFSTAVLIELGEETHRHVDLSLSGEDKFKIWKYARENGIVPEETPIPMDGLIWYGIDQGLFERDELDAWGEFDDDASGIRKTKLPGNTFPKTLELIKENEGVTPIRYEYYYNQDDEEADGDDDQESEPAVTRDEVEKIVRDTCVPFLIEGDAYEPETPLELFLDELTEIDEDVDDPKDSELAVPTAELREAYNTWAKVASEQGDGEVETLNATMFGKGLPNDGRIENHRRRFDGERQSCYAGVALTEEGMKLLECQLDSDQ